MWPGLPWREGRLGYGPRPRVMGIVNITPDSFFHRAGEGAAAADHCRRLVDEGAEVLDLGAESTRPGADEVPVEAEWARLAPVLRIATGLGVPLSVDTMKPEVARRALDHGADWINDVTGGRDPAMRSLAARSGCGFFAMHMRGTPATMKQRARYEDVRSEVEQELGEALTALRAAGCAPERLVADPGIGFAKGAGDSLRLMGDLRGFGRRLRAPVLLGASRKSWMGHALGHPPELRLEGSLAAAAAAHRAGSWMVRVHDVGSTVRFLDALERIEGPLVPPGEEAG